MRSTQGCHPLPWYSSGFTASDVLGISEKTRIKGLVVTLPSGIVGAVHISELRQNDNGLQNLAGLSDYIVELLGSIRVGGLFPCLYGDSIFAVLPGLVPRQRAPSTMS